MKVLLKKNVEKLGNVGDVVEVQRGYARNFLFPQGLATTVSEENIRRLEAERKRVVVQEIREKESLKQLAERLKTTSITIQVLATETGHLFGSVSPKMISDALSKEAIDIDPSSIIIPSPIKELGVYEIEIKLTSEIETILKLWVIGANEPSKKDEATPSDQEPTL